MLELSMEGLSENVDVKEHNGHYMPRKEFFIERSPRSTLSTRSPDSESIDLAMDDHGVDTSIEQLYNNVCEMQSSEYSPSRRSYLSYGDESRIDSELRYLAGVDFEEEVEEGGEGSKGDYSGSNDKQLGEVDQTNGTSAKSVSSARGKGLARVSLISEASRKVTRRSQSLQSNRPPPAKPTPNGSKKLNSTSSMKYDVKNQNGPSERGYLGPYLLKQARAMISSGENPQKILEVALRAKTNFEKSSNTKANLDFVMCLHFIAAIYCRFGQYTQAIPILERSVEIPVMSLGEKHALAKFAGCMQLGDMYAMLGQIEDSILYYTVGLEIQRQVLGEKDPHFGETCRYLAEAHIQVMEFDEAEKLCQMALDIHKEKCSPGSPEEAADRRLLGLICDSKGNYEAALEHYVLASMALAASGHIIDAASIDCNVGDAYLALTRYEEAIFTYQKALTTFKSSKGENHPSVASVFVRLADLYNRIGKFSESKAYCENALRIYDNPVPGSSSEEIASGLVELSAIYESMDEADQALKLLQESIELYGNAPSQQSTIAGIEAQMGVLYYMLASYTESYNTFQSAISKFRATGEKKSALFGVTLNQMGLACVQLYAINEAANCFEEAREILEAECGSYHADTIGVYSNLAGIYDAMGRTADAIEILEFVVGMREERLGTANPESDDERQRLAELLKEAGRCRRRKSNSLETLLVTNSDIITDHYIS